MSEPATGYAFVDEMNRIHTDTVSHTEVGAIVNALYRFGSFQPTNDMDPEYLQNVFDYMAPGGSSIRPVTISLKLQG